MNDKREVNQRKQEVSTISWLSVVIYLFTLIVITIFLHPHDINEEDTIKYMRLTVSDKVLYKNFSELKL